MTGPASGRELFGGIVAHASIEQRPIPPLHLLRADVLDVMPDVPGVAEGVADRTGAFAVKRIAWRHQQCGSRVHGARDQGVRVVHVHVQRGAVAAGRVGPVDVELGEFVADQSVANMP